MLEIFNVEIFSTHVTSDSWFIFVYCSFLVNCFFAPIKIRVIFYTCTLHIIIKKTWSYSCSLRWKTVNYSNGFCINVIFYVAYLKHESQIDKTIQVDGFFNAIKLRQQYHLHGVIQHTKLWELLCVPDRINVNLFYLCDCNLMIRLMSGYLDNKCFIVSHAFAIWVNFQNQKTQKPHQIHSHFTKSKIAYQTARLYIYFGIRLRLFIRISKSTVTATICKQIKSNYKQFQG